MRVILFAMILSMNINTAQAQTQSSGDWKFGNVGGGYCGTWTGKGRMRTMGHNDDNGGNGNTSLSGNLLFFVRFPKDHNQLPIITMEISHDAFRRVANIRERDIPKESTKGDWILVGNTSKKVGSKTKKFAMYTLFPGSMAKVINEIRTDKYLDFYMSPRFKSRIYTNISLKGSTAAMNGTSGTCAGRPGLGITAKNQLAISRLINKSSQSSGYTNWAESVIQQYEKLNTIMAEESQLSAEVSAIENDPEYVQLRSEHSATDSALEASSDELAGTTELVAAYKIERRKKETSELPEAMTEKAQLTARVPGLKKAYESAKAKYDPVVQTLKPYRANVSDKASQLANATSTKNGFISQKNSAEAQLSSIEASISSNLIQIESHRRQISRNNSEMENISEEMDELDQDEIIADIEKEAAIELGEFGSVSFDEMEDRLDRQRNRLAMITENHRKFSVMSEVEEKVQNQLDSIDRYNDLIANLPTEDDFVALEAEMVEKECAVNLKNSNCKALNNKKSCMMIQLGKKKVKKGGLFSSGTKPRCLPLAHLERRKNGHINKIADIQDDIRQMRLSPGPQMQEIRPKKRAFQSCDAHGTPRHCIRPARQLSRVAQVMENSAEERKFEIRLRVEKSQRVFNRMNEKLESRYTHVLTSLQARMRHLEDSNFQLRREIRQANINIDGAKVTKNQLIHRISILSSEIISWTSKESSAKSELAHAESALSKKKAQLNYESLKRAHDVAKASFFPAKERLVAVTEEVEVLKARIAFLRSEIPKLEAHITDLEAKVAALKFKKSGLEANLKPFEQEISALMAKLAPIRVRQNRLMDEITGYLVSKD